MNKVVYSKLDIERVIYPDDPETKIIKGTTNKYTIMKSKYNVGTPDSPYPRALRVQFPVGTAGRGIQSQKNDRGTLDWSIRYVPDDVTEGEVLLEKMVQLKEHAAKSIHKNRSKFHNIKNTTKYEVVLDNLKDIMYVKYDEFGERVEGSIPSKFLKLDEGNINPIYRTRFQRVIGKDDHGNPVMEEVPWELLENMSVTFIPIVEFYRIFSGASGQSYQAKCRSAIVIDVDKPRQTNDHEDTAKSLLENDEYLKEQNEKWKMAQEMAEARARGEDSEEDPLMEDKTEDATVVDALAAVSAVNNIPLLKPSENKAESLTDFVSTETEEPKKEPGVMSNLPTIPGLDVPEL